MEMEKQYKVILTSRGLNTAFGRELVGEVFKREHIDCAGKSIFLLTLPEDGMDEIIEKNCLSLGFSEVYKATDYEHSEEDTMSEVSMIFVSEGNTFDILQFSREHKFDEYVKKNMDCDGVVYIGSSAGAVLAGSDIKIAEWLGDKNRKGEKNYSGFKLLPGDNCKSDTVVPHYTFKERQMFESNLDKNERNRYLNIHNISNVEALVLDIQSNSESKTLIRKRRIRIEE